MQDENVWKDAIEWTNMIVQRIPNGMRDAIDGIEEILDDIETYQERIEKDEQLDETLRESLNDTMMGLKECLDSASSLRGNQNQKRDGISAMIVSYGWEYWFEAKYTSGGAMILSAEKGNDEISFHTIMDNHDQIEGVELIKGFGKTLEWEMFRIGLDASPSVYLGSIPAWQLDLVSAVPALEKQMNNSEAAKRIKDSKRKKNHWQRQLNKDNKTSISAFFDRQEAFFANPVIIHLQSNQYVDIKTNEGSNNSVVNVSLDFISSETKRNQDGLFEWEGRSIVSGRNGFDRRPFDIIDGQHRIRGAANARHNSHQRILVVLLPPELSEQTAGKLFAEINTLSRPLKDKHRMFLAHRFWVNSPDPKYTFGKYNKEDISTHRDRANRFSYDIAARLQLESEWGFWEDKIKFLDQNTKTQQVLGIEKWVEYTHPWFLDYPYTIQKGHDIDDIFHEIDHYFGAWGEIIGDAWDDEKVDHCLFKSKTQARVLLKRFKQVYILARRKQSNGVISQDIFEEILAPLRNIPFTHVEILEKFRTGLPEQSWKHLDSWVHDALNEQNIRSRTEILDSSIRGEAGAGILAYPALPEKWEFVTDPRGLDPSEGDGNTRYLEVSRPVNSGWSCKAEIWHDGIKVNQEITIKTKSCEGTKSIRIPIRNRRPLPEWDNDVKLKIIWTTIAGEADLDFKIR